MAGRGTSPGGGADVTVDMFEGSGHAPFIDAQETCQDTFFGYLERVGR